MSPDGKWVAFTRARHRLRREQAAASTSGSPAIDGARSRRLTTHPENDSEPRVVAPTASAIYFLSTRSGSSQVWRIAPAGGEAEQVTKLPIDVNGFTLFPDGKRLVLAIDVWPDAKTLADSVEARRRRRRSRRSRRARTTSCCSATGTSGRTASTRTCSCGAPATSRRSRDLTPGLRDRRADASVRRHGGGRRSRPTASRSRTSRASAAARTRGRPTPTCSSSPTDGRQGGRSHRRRTRPTTSSRRSRPTASRSRSRDDEAPGLRGGPQRIAIYRRRARKKLRVVTESVGSLAPASSRGRATARRSTRRATTSATTRCSRSTSRPATRSCSSTRARTTAPRVAGDRIVFAQRHADDAGRAVHGEARRQRRRASSRTSTTRASRRSRGATYEQFSFKGAKGDTVYGYVDEAGGLHRRQGARSRSSSTAARRAASAITSTTAGTREVFAGHGYGVVFIDFHGSTGYGQAFTDAISGDWGGAPYEDLMRASTPRSRSTRWLDGNRVGRARRVVRRLHDQLDQRPHRSLQGARLPRRQLRRAHRRTSTPRSCGSRSGSTAARRGSKPEGYAKHNPIEFVKNWKTPTLVIHGGLDYRVVETQGMATFTALQRKGVPSRFLHFPDENHWVLKPQNSKRWHEEVSPGSTGTRRSADLATPRPCEP